jgi:RimJ/RimL family protein N-acetyltransferase
MASVPAVLGPVTLTGRFIQLRPLSADDAPALLQAGRSPEIWDWMSAMPLSAESMREWIDSALEAQRRGVELPFTVLSRSDQKVIGSTRYLDIQEANRTLEIGWTWYAPDAWGTSVNPEAKFLLLEHAFEGWGAVRVALKTDAKNFPSQAAIRKLGAKYEGTLRNHRIRRDGSLRDTVMFSIIDSEWPSVKAALARRLAEHSVP